MSSTNKDHKIALAKCKYHGDGQWVANITPRQMEYLVSLGAGLDEYRKSSLDYYIKDGNNKCKWFYFTPNKQLKERLESINAYKSQHSYAP